MTFMGVVTLAGAVTAWGFAGACGYYLRSTRRAAKRARAAHNEAERIRTMLRAQLTVLGK